MIFIEKKVIICDDVIHYNLKLISRLHFLASNDESYLTVF